MFQTITADKLVVNTKYMILFRQGHHSGVFKGIHKNIFVFDEMYDLVCKESLRRLIYLTSDYRYYEFISDQPQWQMERRSVNMIVRKLIGDDHFTW